MHHDVACRAHKASMCCKGLNNLLLYVFQSTWMHRCPREEAQRQFAMHRYGPALLFLKVLPVLQFVIRGPEQIKG